MIEIRIRIHGVAVSSFGLKEVRLTPVLFRDGILIKEYGLQGIGLDGDSHLTLTLPDSWVTSDFGTASVDRRVLSDAVAPLERKKS